MNHLRSSVSITSCLTIQIVEGREAEWDDIYFGCWLDILRSAILGLSTYNVEENLWGDDHTWGNWVIFNAVKENDPDLMKVEIIKDSEGRDNIRFKVDRSRLRVQGFKAISDLVYKLHVYRCIGDFEEATKFYKPYSAVDEEMLKVREVVIARKRPNRIELQPNLLLTTDDSGAQTVEYKAYTESHEGIIQSHLERYQDIFRKDVYD